MEFSKMLECHFRAELLAELEDLDTVTTFIFSNFTIYHTIWAYIHDGIHRRRFRILFDNSGRGITLFGSGSQVLLSIENAGLSSEHMNDALSSVKEVIFATAK